MVAGRLMMAAKRFAFLSQSWTKNSVPSPNQCGLVLGEKSQKLAQFYRRLLIVWTCRRRRSFSTEAFQMSSSARSSSILDLVAGRASFARKVEEAPAFLIRQTRPLQSRLEAEVWGASSGLWPPPTVSQSAKVKCARYDRWTIDLFKNRQMNSGIGHCLKSGASYLHRKLIVNCQWFVLGLLSCYCWENNFLCSQSQFPSPLRKTHKSETFYMK